MARIRSVHPGLWTDEAFVSVQPLARLLFIGIWTEADDLGCFEWKPVTLKMRVLPVDNADVAALLTELEAANMVMRYSVSGREFGAIRNFCRFQRPKKPKSVWPSTPEVRTYVASEADSSEPEDDETPSGSTPPPSQPAPVPKKGELKLVEPEPVPRKARISPQMEDGGDKKEKERDRSLRSLPHFEAFWAAYPRKVGKDAARKAYAAAVHRGAEPAALLTALRIQRWPDDPQFVPHASTWLNGGRWQDDPEAAAPPPAEPYVPFRNGFAELARRMEANAASDDLLALTEEPPHVRPH